MTLVDITRALETCQGSAYAEPLAEPSEPRSGADRLLSRPALEPDAATCRRPVPRELPATPADDYKGASAVLVLSQNASVALARRRLQTP
jgi:hypothetical protein